MGVFDFVKDAGAKVGIGESTADEEERIAAEAAAKDAAREERAKKVQDRIADRKKSAARADALEIMEERKKAAGLESYVKKLGIEISSLDVKFDDGKAQVTGTAKTQADREKAILAIGNVEGVDQVEDDIKVPEGADEESDLHVVVRGDTLWGLAEKHYGDGRKYPSIFEANRPMLSDPNKIYVGQVLRIPASA